MCSWPDIYSPDRGGEVYTEVYVCVCTCVCMYMLARASVKYLLTYLMSAYCILCKIISVPKVQGVTSWSQRQKFKVITGNQESVRGRRLEEEVPPQFHFGRVISHC